MTLSARHLNVRTFLGEGMAWYLVSGWWTSRWLSLVLAFGPGCTDAHRNPCIPKAKILCAP